MLKRSCTLLLGLLTLTSPLLGAPKKEDPKTNKMAKDCTEFGISLYSSLKKSEAPNLVFSPYSIFSCLSMVYVGARDETAQEMQQVLHLSLKRPDLSKTAYALRKSLVAPGEGTYTLEMANGMWLDRDTFVLSDFRHAIEDGFQAKVQSLDFSQAEKATSIINEWTSNQTHGKISKLLEAGDVDTTTRLVLTNALYFKGSWQVPFDVKNTADGNFFTGDGTKIKTKMMEQTGFFSYLENDNFQLISMPFLKKDEASRPACLILLPKKTVALSDCENLLTAASVQSWIDQLNQEKVNIKMPKFSLDKRYDLNSVLKTLGMENAFNDKADFSGIDGMHDLFLSKVIHESFFALDEAGVTAAAATSASINVTATPAKPLAFTVDRPFLFLLVDLQTKLPLFIGKIQDPSMAQSE